MTQMVAVVRVGDRLIIEIHPALVNTANVRNGALFEEVLTEEGILLKRADTEENKNENVGPTGE